ncbi:radical SAM protein [Christensenellaceae bacterium OttesenSCG-928-M15]|nr:radical SAM protein [Christensenellaceae bacterium OttesenSCG-928-M15]
MRCTLNCRDCMQRVPLRKSKDVPLQVLFDDLEALFQNISFVGEMSIIGGEPLIHRDFEKFLLHLASNYHEKIGSLVITTNGTITPTKDTLELCRNAGIFISISDYGKTLPQIVPGIEALEQSARDFGVQNERKRWSWSDPGRFDEECGVHECELVHMQLYGGRLWRCTLMAAGVLAGLCDAAQNTDYYELLRGEKEALHEFLYAKKTTSQCHVCRYPLEVGIESAVQTERSKQ